MTGHPVVRREREAIDGDPPRRSLAIVTPFAKRACIVRTQLLEPEKELEGVRRRSLRRFVELQECPALVVACHVTKV